MNPIPPAPETNAMSLDQLADISSEEAVVPERKYAEIGPATS